MAQQTMKFRLPDPKRLGPDPVVAKMDVSLPKDVENKKGWKATEAFKDALSDALSAAWTAARKAFAATFFSVFREELDEWADWNPDEVIFTLRLPFKFLHWIPLKKIRMSDLEKWLED